MSTPTVVQAPSAVERCARVLAGPSQLLARIAIAGVYGWLGLIKCVPAWHPNVGRSNEMLTMLTVGKVDGTVALVALGLLQIAAAIAMLVPRLCGAAIILQVLLLGLGVVFAVLHASYLLDPATQMPAAVGIAFGLNMALILAGIALTSGTIKSR